jgi:hypothetical protein
MKTTIYAIVATLVISLASHAEDTLYTAKAAIQFLKVDANSNPEKVLAANLPRCDLSVTLRPVPKTPIFEILVSGADPKAAGDASQSNRNFSHELAQRPWRHPIESRHHGPESFSSRRKGWDETPVKYSSVLRWSSLAATLTLGVLVLYILNGYHAFVQRPGQGGWSLYRFGEIALPLTPLVLLFASLLVSRATQVSRGLRYAAGAGLVISTPFALFVSGVFMVLVAAALVLHFLYVRSDSASPNVAWGAQTPQ